MTDLRQGLSVGQRVRLEPDRNWWTVQAVTEHFAACVQHVPFTPKGTLRYTVLDWRNKVRGPCNLIGQGCGDGSYSEKECAEMLTLFEAHKPHMADLAKLPMNTFVLAAQTLEVSHRNRVPLSIVQIKECP